MPKTMQEVGWSFIFWSVLYLEGWSSRSSYFIGVALPFFCEFEKYLELFFWQR